MNTLITVAVKAGWGNKFKRNQYGRLIKTSSGIHDNIT